jgi:hypothetical protein
LLCFYVFLLLCRSLSCFPLSHHVFCPVCYQIPTTREIPQIHGMPAFIPPKNDNYLGVLLCMLHIQIFMFISYNIYIFTHAGLQESSTGPTHKRKSRLPSGTFSRNGMPAPLCTCVTADDISWDRLTPIPFCTWIVLHLE